MTKLGKCVLVLTVREFCQRYRVGRTFAYEEMNAGRLEYFHYGRHRRIAVDAAERWLEKKQRAAKLLRELRAAENYVCPALPKPVIEQR